MLFRSERPVIEPSFRGLIDASETLLLSHISSELQVEGPLIPVGPSRALMLGTPPRTRRNSDSPDAGWDPVNRLFAAHAWLRVVEGSTDIGRPLDSPPDRVHLTEKSKRWPLLNPDTLSRYQRLMANAQLVQDAAAVTLGLVRLNRQPTRVADLVSLMVSLYRAEADSKRQQLLADVACPDLVVPIDRDKAVQIVGNLISNACKFTTAGGHITVRASHRSRQLHIEVEDTGIGIIPEFHGRIFEQFMEAPQGLARDPHRGLGIGLYLVRELTRLHGGDVTVASRPGYGSIFTVSLPT